MSAERQFHLLSKPHHKSNHRYDEGMRQTVIILISGISLWVVALVVEIARSAPSNAIWICVTGALFGVLGLRYSIKRLRREGL
jgi:hypothetical protein